jgi:hypothetical protein
MDGEYTNRTLPTKWWITRHSQSSFNNTEITRWRAQGTTPQGLQVYVVEDSPYHEELYPYTVVVCMDVVHPTGAFYFPFLELYYTSILHYRSTEHTPK